MQSAAESDSRHTKKWDYFLAFRTRNTISTTTSTAPPISAARIRFLFVESVGGDPTASTGTTGGAVRGAAGTA